MDPQSFAILFKAPEIIKGIAALLGLIESVDQKIDKLLKSDFNSGTRCLKELVVSKNTKQFLLEEGWRHFHSAITHEELERKALSYIGLSFCQYHLGESKMAVKTLNELIDLDIKDVKSRKKIKILKGISLAPKVLFSIVCPPLAIGTGIAIFKLLKEGEDSLKINKDFNNYWNNIPSEKFIFELKKSAKEWIISVNHNNNDFTLSKSI